MRDRIVVIALGVVVAAFLFEVVWPIMDDDPPSALQTAYFSVGLVVATVTALFSFGGRH
jgi:hypothetical protein